MANFRDLIKQNGGGVYSPSNKPTPADLGAVNKAGDTITGELKVNVIKDTSNNTLFNANAESGNGTYIANPVKWTRLFAKDGLIQVQNQNSNIYRIYHQGYKPTAADVGAITQSTADSRYLAKTAKAADSNLLDGLDSSKFLRGDTSDTFAGSLTSGTRNGGVFGVYDSNKVDHIWSMGTAYKIHESGTNFGNLYGLAYKHTNNTTGGTMGGGHQMVWCTNGSAKASIGEHGIWTNGYVNGANSTFTGNYNQNSSTAQIFHAGTSTTGSTLTMRSMRESTGATWTWEKYSNGNIAYSTGTNASGENRITFNTSVGDIYAKRNIIANEGAITVKGANGTGREFVAENGAERVVLRHSDGRAIVGHASSGTVWTGYIRIGSSFEYTSGSTKRFSVDSVGNLFVTGSVNSSTLGVSNNSSTSGKGLSLYSGPTSGMPTYGIAFAGTSTFGKHGSVQSDWATYLTMSSSATRGWIFKAGSGSAGNVASISGNGHAQFNGSVNIGGNSRLGYSSSYEYMPYATGTLDGISTRSQIRSAANILIHADHDGSGSAERIVMRAGVNGGSGKEWNELSIESKKSTDARNQKSVKVNGHPIYHEGNKPPTGASVKRIRVNGDANTCYPVVIDQNTSFGYQKYTIGRGYNWTAPSSWNTSSHKGGLTFAWLWSGDRYWGGNDQSRKVIKFHESYTNMIGGFDISTTGSVVWLRGGGADYDIWCDSGNPVNATIYLSTYTDSADRTYSPLTWNSSAAIANRKSISNNEAWLSTGGGRINGTIERGGHSVGYLVGAYNSVAPNSAYTNPIYTIGSNYKPSDTSLGNMYGLGYCAQTAPFIPSTLKRLHTSGWGTYFAADGDARIFLNATTGQGEFAGSINTEGAFYVKGRRVSETFKGTGAPSSSTGQDGDVYLRYK